jgi:hypothetical protein
LKSEEKGICPEMGILETIPNKKNAPAQKADG